MIIVLIYAIHSLSIRIAMEVEMVNRCLRPILCLLLFLMATDATAAVG